MATLPNSAGPKLLGHLHYGGSQNLKTGRLGPKPAQGKLFKMQRRMETMIRLENAGVSEAASAAMLSISVPRFRYLKKSPEYLIARTKLTHGIILDQDAQLSMIKEQRREILAEMLPPALQILANELQRPAITIQERRHQTGLALELMDREGTFAKISRTEVKPVEFFDFEQADAASQNIISAIRGLGVTAEATHTAAAVRANEAFSSSHTLSAIDQQAALAVLESVSEEELRVMLPTDGTMN